MNIRKIIKEELLKEVGGYDDQNTMANHAGHVMNVLSGSYNDLSNTLHGLANAVSDGASKKDLIGFLVETSKNIDMLTNIINTIIKDFTEDDLIDKAKMVIKSLNSFRKKINVLSSFSDAMGGEEEFVS